MLREILENALNEKKGGTIRQFAKQYLEDLVEYDETYSSYVNDYFTNGDTDLKNYRKEAKVPDDVPDEVIIGDIIEVASKEVSKILKGI